MMMMDNKDGRFKVSFLEVFSVQFVTYPTVNFDEIYGFILIDSTTPTHLLFRRLRGDPCKINSQGLALLEGPRRLGWSVNNEVFIVPFLFNYEDFNFEDKFEETYADYLWNFGEYDKVICKTLHSEFGCIKVNFAVYEDGVEGHLQIMLQNCSFSSAEVYGIITATNSLLKGDGASIVFEKEFKDVNAQPSKEVGIPLSRPIIALPIGSALKLAFNIFSRGESIDCQDFECPVQVGHSEKILEAKCCLVEVKVDFFNVKPELGVDDDEDYF